MSIDMRLTKNAQPEDQHLYYNTATLARFLRACYGKAAPQEAQRHVTSYTGTGQSEIAEIWKRVHAHLTGIEMTEDARRVLKSTRHVRG